MALSLAVKLGGRVFIGDRPFTVVGQPDVDRCVIETDDGRTIMLRDDRMIEVYDQTMIGVDARAQRDTAWLLFNAPPEIVILREKKYFAQREEGACIV